MPESPSIAKIQTRIHPIRGHAVILQNDLARLYNVPLPRLVAATHTFPGEYCFVLESWEVPALCTETNDTRRRPLAFTEHGALAVAYALASHEAMATSLQIVRAFIRAREVARAVP